MEKPHSPGTGIRAAKPRSQRPRGLSPAARSATQEAKLPKTRAQGWAPQMQPFSSSGESGCLWIMGFSQRRPPSTAARFQGCREA